MENEIGAIEAVSSAVERLTVKGRFIEFKLTNGIVLQVKSVPPLLIQGVTKEFVTPPPPKVYIEELGKDEENPNDPAYIREVEQLIEQQNTAITDLVLAMGTSCVSVPEGYFRPEEDGWIAAVKFATEITGRAVNIDEGHAVKRYLYWLRFYALETQEDVIVANNLPLQVGGIRETEIDELVEFFRSLSQRGTNRESPAPVGSEDGNPPNRAARRASSRVGRA